MKANEQTPECPKCGTAANVIPFQYGLPVGELPDENDVILGGCCIGPDAPIWHCKTCKSDFGRLDERMEFRPRKPRQERKP